MARPTKMTPEVLGKTKEAYLMGCSTQMANGIINKFFER